MGGASPLPKFMANRENLMCRTCKRPCSRLIYGPQGSGCNHCYERKNVSNPNLHIRGVNRLKPKMTYADKMHITAGHMENGQWRRDPRWI